MDGWTMHFWRIQPLLASSALLVLTLYGTITDPYTSGRVIQAVLCVTAAVVFVRAWRSGVELDERDITVRRIRPTSRLRWDRVEGAERLYARYASPFFRDWQVLGVRLTNGRLRRFQSVSSPPRERSKVSQVVDEINRRCAARSTASEGA